MQSIKNIQVFYSSIEVYNENIMDLLSGSTA